MTDYIILRKIPESELEATDLDKWEEVGVTVKAGAAYRALSIYKDTEDVKAGVHVAVSTRSWRPLPIKIDHRTVVTVG